MITEDPSDAFKERTSLCRKIKLKLPHFQVFIKQCIISNIESVVGF